MFFEQLSAQFSHRIGRKMIYLLMLNIFAVINTYILQDPIYSPDYLYESVEDYRDIRQKFLDKRRLNRVTNKQVQLIDSYLSNSSIYIDGIAHQRIDENHTQWKSVVKVENEFKSLIMMKGLTYTYKRDTFWRTWRRVRYPNGKDRIVCYKCQNTGNCTECTTASYWIIEYSPPPCPLEIFSIFNVSHLCVVNITNNTNIQEVCPSIVQTDEVTTMCDNPIDTKWQIQRVYNQVSERFPDVICGGRDFCEISTVYAIKRDYISFRIINSTNHIIYSRIMKNGGKNYACVHCGRIDPITKSVIKDENRVKIDLFKRHDNFQEYPTTRKTEVIDSLELFYNYISKINYIHKSTKASCKSLKKMYSSDEQK